MFPKRLVLSLFPTASNMEATILAWVCHGARIPDPTKGQSMLFGLPWYIVWIIIYIICIYIYVCVCILINSNDKVGLFWWMREWLKAPHAPIFYTLYMGFSQWRKRENDSRWLWFPAPWIVSEMHIHVCMHIYILCTTHQRPTPTLERLLIVVQLQCFQYATSVFKQPEIGFEALSWGLKNSGSRFHLFSRATHI